MPMAGLSLRYRDMSWFYRSGCRTRDARLSGQRYNDFLTGEELFPAMYHQPHQITVPHQETPVARQGDRQQSHMQGK